MLDVKQKATTKQDKETKIRRHRQQFTGYQRETRRGTEEKGKVVWRSRQSLE